MPGKPAGPSMFETSSSGALVEGPGLPLAGVTVSLRRGSLQASGQIVWVAGRRAGVTFDTFVHVADWMLRETSPHQAAVDQMASDVRLGTALSTLARSNSAELAVREELATLRAELCDLSAALVDDPILVATHPEIQMLDVAIQRIDRISVAITPGA